MPDSPVPSPAARLLVVVNDPESGPGHLAGWLVAAGVEFDVRFGAHGTLPAVDELDAYDGMIALGGGFMPDDTARAPWLAREAGLVARCLADGIPLLGICLGCQLLAQVAGGTVAAATGAPEKGSTPITMTEAAAGDTLFRGLPRTTRFIESHVDRITALPQDAVVLAGSAVLDYQAFRIGEAAWGVQFHPEHEGPDAMERWNAEALAALGFDKDELIARARVEQPATEAAARTLVLAFVAVAEARARARQGTEGAQSEP
ncbi:type 1 glutamine amidotransferase [Brevibacterium sp. 50QC2O2]|uniref:type 1 glutamine amidotransferase n=1 Tax=Brevibacterium TaxID=1696 RepID=UPI00211C526A|nr:MULTISPECIES: type 1 glutamine amidotransferase [unclassified Brevibacterium]MCQ9384673.1 type 1 glutamine amidotransferase [Brevibacterium sp. 68QC2CO]MCQ9389259.1 type 1 glutamine amidotransferase [Brevibacterium sp. 50QC2O2]